ncbi:MAG: aldo/keto reductase [Actinomycetaceae bacterium]|nr:aldo/keto reductase [Actinomycetaceae bacterium]
MSTHREDATPTIPNVTMNTGATMPIFGYGTFKVEPKDAQQYVETALDLGIRHIDTAQMYRNEKEVGQGIRRSGIERSQIFLTTKLNNSNHLQDDARRSIEQSLVDLGVDYVDLFLIHWPLPTLYDGDYVSTWKTMLDFEKEGLAKAVGVSNFQIDHLQKIIQETGRVPAVNQIEAHPQFANNELRAFHQAQGIVTQAWSPLGRGAYLDAPELLTLSERYNKTPAQIVLRWAIERGDVIFPKASTRERIAENMALFDWTLTEEAIATIDKMDLGEPGRRGSHPDTMDWVPDF